MRESIHQQAVEFRKKKLIEVKRKIFLKEADQFEINMIKFWKGVYGDRCFK